jgi:hypothetical protein
MQAPQPGTMPIGVEQMQQKPGFFQRSGVKTAAGILGDTLLTLGGGQAMYAPMMQQRKLQEEDARIRQQMFEQKRIAEREDKQWEWQNKPRDERAPYRWEANDGSLMEVGPDGQPRQVYKDPTPKTTYISVDNSDGTKTVVPVVNGQIMGGGQRPQIGAVVADPRKQGGQAAPPPATFRGGL